MLRATKPAISFSASSILLKSRVSRPLLSADMHTNDRLCLVWDDLPWTFYGVPRYKEIEWYNYATYELGLRRIMYSTSKMRWIFMNVAYCLMLLILFDQCWQLVYHAYTKNGVPEEWSIDHGKEFSKKWHGIDVWCADGKFVRPFFHMFPPMYTMTIDELEEDDDPGY